MTLPALLVAAIRFFMTRPKLLAGDLTAVADGKTPLWVWGMSFLTGLLLASYFAWLEQFKTVQTLTGRPDVTLRITELPKRIARFVINNSNSHVAVNISALSIDFTIPEGIRQEQQSTQNAFGMPELDLPTKWVVKFGTVQALLQHQEETLPFRIEGVGTLQTGELEYVLRNVATEVELRVPIVVTFSNLGPPTRIWHSHYLLKYNVAARTLVAEYITIGELFKSKTMCAGCTTNRS